MKISTDPICPLCKEAEETAMHFLGQCAATMHLRLKLMGSAILTSEEIRQMTLCTLLSFVKLTKRFKQPFGLLGLRIGPTMVSALAGDGLPEEKVKVSALNCWFGNKKARRPIRRTSLR